MSFSLLAFLPKQHYLTSYQSANRLHRPLGQLEASNNRYLSISTSRVRSSSHNRLKIQFNSSRRTNQQMHHNHCKHLPLPLTTQDDSASPRICFLWMLQKRNRLHRIIETSIPNPSCSNFIHGRHLVKPHPLAKKRNRLHRICFLWMLPTRNWLHRIVSASIPNPFCSHFSGDPSK